MKNTVLLEASYDNRYFEIPPKYTVFFAKKCGPIKKRVAPSDSSKNFGLGGMLPKFLYRHCIACKIGSSNGKKQRFFQFLEPERSKDRFLQALQ